MPFVLCLFVLFDALFRDSREARLGLAVLGAPVVAAIFAPGFMSDEYKFQLTSDMIRITFPYLFLISMTGFCGAILNSYGRFSVPAFTPVFLNLSLICSAKMTLSRAVSIPNSLFNISRSFSKLLSAAGRFPARA